MKSTGLQVLVNLTCYMVLRVVRCRLQTLAVLRLFRSQNVKMQCAAIHEMIICIHDHKQSWIRELKIMSDTKFEGTCSGVCYLHLHHLPQLHMLVKGANTDIRATQVPTNATVEHDVSSFGPT